MRSQKTATLMVILFIPLIWACQNDPVGPEASSEAVTAMKPAPEPVLAITPAIMVLNVGDEGRFQVECPLHQAQVPGPEEVRWISIDPEIAAMDPDGTVHALSPGLARIIAEGGDLMDTAFVRVLDQRKAWEGSKE